MRISFVMLNNHDIISLIENRLDSVSAEYQSVDNKIEIYRLDGDLIILEIDQKMFSILYKENKYAHEAILKTKDGVEFARVIYSPHKPLSCGARVWVELDTDITDVDLIVRQGDSE